MLDALAEITATYGTLVVAAMGVVVSVIPNIARRLEKWWWVAGFAVVGIVVSTANYYEVHSANVTQQQILNIAAGGSGYCYMDIAKAAGGGTSFAIINPGSEPVFDVDIHFFEMQPPDGQTRQVIDVRRGIIRPGLNLIDEQPVRRGFFGGLIQTRSNQGAEILNVGSIGEEPTKRFLQVYRHHDYVSGSGELVPLRHEDTDGSK